jgi:NAD(P)-dependent dehydrogenase (short-subunit alcohol dehydrogenase family)
LRCGGKVHEIAEEAWDLCFDVNVKGTFLLCIATQRDRVAVAKLAFSMVNEQR